MCSKKPKNITQGCGCKRSQEASAKSNCSFFLCGKTGSVILQMPNGSYRFSPEDFLRFAETSSKISRQLLELGLSSEMTVSGHENRQDFSPHDLHLHLVKTNAKA